ncbi:MAG: hypothetical protein PVJ39_10150 [Gammaproteobacteria bacterium]|jgi:hypothetical protein
MPKSGMITKIKFLLLICLTGIGVIENAFAFDWQERRRDQFGRDFSYFVYPIAGDIPGLGSAAGIGATVLNINDSDLDFTGFNVQGDFDAAGYTFLDYHIIKNRLILDAGYYNFKVAPVQYTRGIDSSDDDYVLPKVEGKYFMAQLTLSFFQRQAEAYIRTRNGRQRLLQVLDESGNEFTAVDTSKRSVADYTLGVTLDNTDDRLDPRSGYRVEASLTGYKDTDSLSSDFFVADYNLTGYLPFRRWDTLVFNVFASRAHLRHRVDADFATLQQERGLGCNDLPPGPERDNCLATEADFINEQLAYNEYGAATALGGTQRLRSFANGRFYAGQSFFYGVEYRLNLTDERVPFNWYVAKGIRTGIQLALFAEQGSVADHTHNLFDTLKTSVGVGVRLVLTGVIIRADYATGNEGSEFILFINYPWSMFSVDS